MSGVFGLLLWSSCLSVVVVQDSLSDLCTTRCSWCHWYARFSSARSTSWSIAWIGPLLLQISDPCSFKYPCSFKIPLLFQNPRSKGLLLWSSCLSVVVVQDSLSDLCTTRCSWCHWYARFSSARSTSWLDHLIRRFLPCSFRFFTLLLQILPCSFRFYLALSKSKEQGKLGQLP